MNRFVLLAVTMLLSVSFLAGCKRKTDIAEKKPAVAQIYFEATQEEIAAGKRIYPARGGEKTEFGISPDVCLAFGFLAGSKVETPEGEAYVVGVSNGKGKGQLWFHKIGDDGAAYWEDFKKPQFEKEGFKLISEPSVSATVAPTVSAESEPIKEPDPPKTAAVPKIVEKVEESSDTPLKVKKLQPIPPVPGLIEE